jgi:hypothetical protein
VTPTARGFLEAVMKKLQSLAPLGACSDLRFSPVSAWFERDGAGYDTSGSEVAIRPRALSHQLASLPRDLPFLLAARADEDGDDYKSGSEVWIRPRALCFPWRWISLRGGHPYWCTLHLLPGGHSPARSDLLPRSDLFCVGFRR